MDDRSLETLLAQHFGSRLVIRKKSRPVYGDDGQFDSVDDGFSVALESLKDGEGDFLVALEFMNKPADPVFVSGQFARLRAVLPRTAESNQDIELLIDVMVEDCKDYPRDVISHVAKNWRLTHRFFPSPIEFRAELDRAVALRRALLDAFSTSRMEQIAAPKKEQEPLTYKEKNKTEWTQKDWDEYIGDALGMVELAKKNPTVVDVAGWEDELKRRQQDRKEHQC